jgi:V8-like Glu-specific endopeptidase
MPTATLRAAASRVTLVVLALLFFAAFTTAPPLQAEPGKPASAPMRIATEGITYAEHVQWQADLHRWLTREAPAAALASPVQVTPTRAEIDAIDRGSRRVSPLPIGLVKGLAPAIDLTGNGRSARAGAGAIIPTADGGFVWAMVVRSDEAGAVRLHIERMSLPSGAALYVYSPAGEAYGPYLAEGPDGSGEFWTTAVFGREAVLQVRVPGGLDEADLRGLSLRVTEAGLITANFAAGLAPAPESKPVVEAIYCGNAACIEDATCHNGTPAEPEKLAAAKMEWVQGAFIYTCTGGLINDSNPSQSNFFLTANHCLSKSNTAKNVSFYWRFATASCGDACPSNNGWPFKTTGATVSATGRKGDFTLLHLNANPPSGSVFLGWTSAPVANTNGAHLYRVSNPNFGGQTYSEHDVSTNAPTCSGWPRGERIYSRDVLGATAGGSSGSPVLNGSSQVVGQLSGSCGTNVNDDCDAVNNATVDGAFAFYFATVQPILAP